MYFAECSFSGLDRRHPAILDTIEYPDLPNEMERLPHVAGQPYHTSNSSEDYMQGILIPLPANPITIYNTILIGKTSIYFKH